MKIIKQLEQESKQARDDMREVMLDEFGIGATLSDRILSLMIRAVQSNIAHNDASKEVSCDKQSMESYIEDLVKAKLRRNEEKASENYLHGDGSGNALPEVSQEERDSDGWIVWNGGAKALTRENVQVKFRNGQDDFGKVLDWNWNHERGEWDIIAYRIVK